MRRHNLGVVLTLVHRSRGASRADLTRRTGLNRSTIAGLVAELVDRRLVLERDPDPSNQVGRPSPVVVPDPRVVGIALSLDTDSITIGVVGFDGTVHKRIRYDTEAVPTATESVRVATAVIEGMGAELAERYLTIGIGVAVPGLVRSSDGRIALAPHLDWHDEPIARMLEESTGYPTAAGNDASLGALAELVFGAAQGFEDVVYLNGSAGGIGGALVIGGRAAGGADGYAGEFGHLKVTGEGTDIAEPESGTLEQMVNRHDLLVVTGLTPPRADELEAALVGERDRAVDVVVHRQLDYLAVALRNAINILNPQRVVLGGFLSALLASDADYLRARVAAQTLEAPFESTVIVRGELGSNLLMIGAAELAFARLLADPAATTDEVVGSIGLVGALER